MRAIHARAHRLTLTASRSPAPPPAPPDGSEVEATIWPRAAAAAERQWSYDVVTTTAAPGGPDRLQAFRCLLLERGIAAAPVTNAVARSAPAGPGSCMKQ